MRPEAILFLLEFTVINSVNSFKAILLPIYKLQSGFLVYIDVACMHQVCPLDYLLLACKRG